MSSNKQPEFVLQCELFDKVVFLALDIPELSLFHASFNGVRVARKTSNDMALSGLLPGLPDTCLPVARCGYHGLYIELKKPGGKCKQPDPNQKVVITLLREQGYFVAVMNNLEQMVELIMNYINNRIEDLDEGVY